jgi:hypothetical protein
MPDNVATPPADAPALMTDAQITEEAVTKGLEAAAAIEPAAVVVEPVEVEEVEVPPVEEAPPADTPPVEEPPAVETPPAEEPPAEIAPEDMTDEQKDRVDAKELGFKNMKATEEFVKMRAELRELRPLQEKLADVEPMAERWNKVYTYCQTNDIDADNFAAGMAMIAGTKSKDPTIMLKTIEGLEWEADRLRKKMGVAGGKYDPLTEPANADLARAVENEEMTPQWAQQQARQRAELQHRTQLEQSQRETQTQQQSANQARTAAISEIDAIGVEYAALDPQYQAKMDLLVPMLQPVFAKLPPNEWPGALRQAYAAFKLPAGAAAPAAPVAVAPLRNQPLRPGAVALQKKQVMTEDDVFERAFAAARAIDGVPG